MRDVLLRLITVLINKELISMEELSDVESFVDLTIKDSFVHRKVVPKRIKCRDSERLPCEVITSIRAGDVAIRCEGGTQWAHLTKTQASDLGHWLIDASK